MEPETRYIAVKFVDFFRRPPTGPEGDGPQTTSFVLTVQFSSGKIMQLTEEVTWETDNWRLFGPFEIVQ